jgi:hypothetical protein
VDADRRHHYLSVMKATSPEMIVPTEFPQLAGLVWNGNPSRAIGREEAFTLYERYWRFVDRDRLTPAETDLIRRLTEEFGGGRFLG